ncbi:TfoX/Sxy family protein [Demequina sp.]|uniref:TfoX/Sxy family protein n=1 Tax=Demequina sp. TaxID=2050685 RepID=UPI003D13717C
MSTSKDTMAFILEQLEPLPVRARAMFGEYGLYCEDKVVGFVCDDTIFLKPSDATAGLALGPAYPGSKDYAIVGADLLEDADALRDMVRATADSLPPPKPKPAKRKS